MRAPFGHATRTSHAPHERLARHRHREGYVAVVLAGAYEEAGDAGRHHLRAGDVLVHQPFEAHLDRFAGSGAEVLVLPLAARWRGSVRARVRDADAIVRATEQGVEAGLQALDEAVRALPEDGSRRAAAGPGQDWPDALAEALLADPSLRIGDWAAAHGLHPGTVGRGFGACFAVSAATFRRTARVHAAIDLIETTSQALAQVALSCGFADQSHLSREVVALTCRSPLQLRRGAQPRPPRSRRAA